MLTRKQGLPRGTKAPEYSDEAPFDIVSGVGVLCLIERFCMSDDKLDLRVNALSRVGRWYTGRRSGIYSQHLSPLSLKINQLVRGLAFPC